MRAHTSSERPAPREPARRHGRRAAPAMLALQRTAGNRATRALIQRRLEVRPPGRGEASAFDRRQELVDRLNAVSGGLAFRLEDRALVYDVVDEAALTDFDRRMRDFIDREQLVPMRLITRHGLVGGPGAWEPLLLDSFINAYVDIDDLLGGTDLSFQMVMVHFLAERFAVRDYARRIGTDMPFTAAHAVGRARETEFLRSALGDETLRFHSEESMGNQLWFRWRSRKHRYWVIHILRPRGRGLMTGDILVLTFDGQRFTADEWLARGGAAGAAAGEAEAAPAVVP